MNKCDTCDEMKNTEFVFFVDVTNERIYSENLCFECTSNLDEEDQAFSDSRVAEKALAQIVNMKGEDD